MNTSPKPQSAVSAVIKSVYGTKDVNRMNAFNQANKEILQFLQRKGEDRKIAKVFDYVINRKLDGHEIVAFDPLDFHSTLDVTKTFQKLKGVHFSEKIDSIYRSKRLWLPKFESWVASDLNVGPSDRGQLEPEPSEFGSKDGQVGKIKYNKYGEKRFEPITEM